MNRNPNYTSFHQSITDELYSIKDRIRNLVSHWPTDGESKEVALRSVLRRHLPSAFNIGRGFIVTQNDSSTQLDILITDSSKPTLFREGDLIIVTPDAVRAIVEVKSKISSGAQVKDAVGKLVKVGRMCRDNGITAWTGLFSFEVDQVNRQTLLQSLADGCRVPRHPIDALSAGRESFIRFWENGRAVANPEDGPVWHSYNLPGFAPSYFIGNLLNSLSGIDGLPAGYAWFPVTGGKEQHRDYYIQKEGSIAHKF